MPNETLQWGGRFTAPPNAALLAFGSSLEDDLVLAPFDVRCSHAHVEALGGAGLLDAGAAAQLHAALDTVAAEIANGTFEPFARGGGYEDVHGAIDARVRALVPPQAGELLHAGRSRNDQVATTLLLYVRHRAHAGQALCARIARSFLHRAQAVLPQRTLLAATTHWQPAQPVLLAFWLHAAAQPFVRAARRFERVGDDAAQFCPLGAGALAGSSLALDRAAAARYLGFVRPSHNALDTVGDRDIALDLLHAVARAAVAASRPSEEFVIWSTPPFGYARLSDAASTGSSLMPQKRNPDPFELVRAAGAAAIGALTGALGTLNGVALSYHRDLQATKAQIVRGTERGLAAVEAFALALDELHFDEDAMTRRATEGFTTATDVADALIARGTTARDAHRLVGAQVAAAEGARTAFGDDDLASLRTASGIDDLTAPLSGPASVEAKRTAGSTHPDLVEAAIDASLGEVEHLEGVPD